MGFLFPDYNKFGPGVDPEAPRKRGGFRLWEVFSRDYWFIMLTGLLALAGSLPFIAGIAIAYRTHSLLIMILAGMIGGMIAAPGICGLADVLLRCLRDEPGFWWYRYRNAMKRNWKGSLFPGALFGTVFSVQCFTLLHLPQSGSGLGMFMCQLVSMLVSESLFQYFLMQIVLMELPLQKMLKNSIWLSVRYLPKTLLASLLQLIYWLAIVLCFPVTAVIMLLTSIWLPLLIAFVGLYPAVDDVFQIEKRLHEEETGSEEHPVCK